MTIAQTLRDALAHVPEYGYTCWCIETAAYSCEESNAAIMYYQTLAWSGPDGEGVPSLYGCEPDTAPNWWSRAPESYELERYALLEMAALSAEREGV